MENTTQIPELPQEPEKRPSKFLLRTRIYLRELSIIIVGILITIVITNFVSGLTRQRELKGMLKLVTREMKENANSLNTIWKRYEQEIYMFGLLRDKNFDISTIPADTLEKYRPAIGNAYNFTVEKDSYEVLRSSIISQYVREKGLMARLSAAYGKLDDLSRQLQMYSNRKSEYFYPMLESLEPDQTDLWMNGSAYDWFSFPVNDRGFRTFVITGPTIISEGTFEDCDRTLARAIAQMESYGY